MFFFHANRQTFNFFSYFCALKNRSANVLKIKHISDSMTQP